jgi:hypothetical protein
MGNFKIIEKEINLGIDQREKRKNQKKEIGKEKKIKVGGIEVEKEVGIEAEIEVGIEVEIKVDIEVEIKIEVKIKMIKIMIKDIEITKKNNNYILNLIFLEFIIIKKLNNN